MLREEGAERCGGVMHCFVEDWATAQAAMELGFFISFSGIVTFKTATALQDVAKRVPQEFLLSIRVLPVSTPNTRKPS